MSAISAQSVLMTEEEFLAAEPHYEVKHEFLAGMVYAMAGASTRHNVIAMNLSGILHSRLRGRRCQAFGSDMKLRLTIAGSPFFFYPDAMIVCDRAGLGKSWCEAPTVVFEIISESTRQTDEREKQMAYLAVPGLAAYVRIEQDTQRVIIEHRIETGWQHEILDTPDAIVRLAAVDVEFPLAELYERLDW